MIYNPIIYKHERGVVFKRNNLTIGNDVWIGYGVLIMPSINKIENGVVIGAGSIVTRDVPDYAICAGNPCKII